MRNPPIVKGSALWQLYQWSAHPIEYLEDCDQRYGDCFVAHIGPYRNFVFFSNPEAIAQIFTTNPAQFDVGRANQLVRSTTGDYSVLLLDGKPHERQRKLLMPPFHGDRMRAYGQLICLLSEQVAQQWQVGVPFKAQSQMQAISLLVILQAVFGLSEGDRLQQLKTRLEASLEYAASPLFFPMAVLPILRQGVGPWQPWQRHLNMIKAIDELLYAEIRDRRQNLDSNRTDILSLLLSARDEAGQPMSDVELRDELITLLIAGHETTAIALSWALYWIHTMPVVKQMLLKELQSLGSDPDPSSIVHLPYLNAVICETLRIYPVAPITGVRIAKTAIQIGEYEFEPETYLTPCVYLVHHREDLYPEPQQFKPERFLERQFSPYEYIPFGGSNRRCIGAAFAMYEMKLVLATLLSRYQLELMEDKPVVPNRRGVTMAPKGGVKMVVNVRNL